MVHSVEATFERQIARMSNEQENLDSLWIASLNLLEFEKYDFTNNWCIYYLQLQLYPFLISQGQCSDTSTAESGSDLDDSFSSIWQSRFTFPRLAPVHEEVSS